MKQFRNTFAEISGKNLRHNCRFLLAINKEMGSPFFCPMVKADGYGHGLISVARILEEEGVTHLGVSLVEEAVALREANIQAEILVFGGFSQEGANQLIKNGCTPVVGSWRQWRALSQVLSQFFSKEETQKRYPIHIKLDTGMSRMGFVHDEIEKIKEEIVACSTVKIIGIGTHLMAGEDIADPLGDSIRQLTLFKKFMRDLGEWCEGVDIHCLNSPGALGLIELLREEIFPKELLSVAKGMRPGLALYGVLPENIKRENFDLRPVMSLKGEVMSVREVKKGQKISYGGTWKAESDSLLALIFCGYADGYPRCLSNKSLALYKGERVPQVGRVCMGYTFFDVTELAIKGKTPKEGENFTLFGKEGSVILCVSELSHQAEMIPYEILTGISPRVPRILK